MRLASILTAGGGAAIGVHVPRAGGVRTGEEGAGSVLDLSVARPDLPRGMCRFLALGAEATAAAASAREEAGAGRWDDYLVPLADVRWLPVVPRPRKFLAIGLNYVAHAEETGRQPPEFPTVFNKQSSCVNAHGGAIVVPRESDAVDYEGELAIVIGRRCRRVERSDAPAVIAGFTIVNDVSVRDWQRRSPTMIMGKGWDSHGPMGPWLVTSDAVPDPHALRLRTLVDGEVRQDGNTADLVFDCYRIVEILSTAFTLEPGDVIATGTPSGVGVASDPPRFLRPGQTVRIEIDGLGALENPVVEDTGSATTGVAGD